jgi:hypothetical protein
MGSRKQGRWYLHRHQDKDSGNMQGVRRQVSSTGLQELSTKLTSSQVYPDWALVLQDSAHGSRANGSVSSAVLA